MREIKFKAWNRKEKIMYPEACPSIGGDFFLPYRTADGKFGGINPDIADLLQFTGLKDKNGKDTYEGDILAYSQMGLQKDQCGDIRFHEGSFVIWMNEALSKSVDTRNPFISIGNCIVYEVVGNIYENLDLIKDLTNK